ncbi:TIGR00725 family protein [Methanocella sp. CWC-04]|uniref:TIGR00725 family protein n=1 Tax=Methanooceanicella nereidis TaxID=2052831 RepID=A0AAP2RFS2_9EURY|nr:TIGR00725 family protein [Methanocella sp. CWC-04]MCD1295285.1 TIGR00725 family protein [Methanocella sp. CWC-04]
MTRRHIISVIGDGYLPEGSQNYILAERLGRSLVDNGYRVLSGGLGGVMEAVSKGAKSSANYKEGDIIGILPGYDPGKANKHIDIAIATGLDHTRNAIVANGDAVVAIGGGAGTLSEISFAWILKRLIIAYKVEGWSGELSGRKIDRTIRYEDMPEDRVFSVTSEQEVIELLKNIPKYSKRHN